LAAITRTPSGTGPLENNAPHSESERARACRAEAQQGEGGSSPLTARQRARQHRCAQFVAAPPAGWLRTWPAWRRVASTRSARSQAFAGLVMTFCTVVGRPVIGRSTQSPARARWRHSLSSVVAGPTDRTLKGTASHRPLRGRGIAWP